MNNLYITNSLFSQRGYILKTDPDTNPLDKLPSILKQDLDKNLCTCMDVPKMDVIDAIVNGATTVDEVKNQTYAATGAGCCVQQVERLIDCLYAPEPRKRRTRRKEKSNGAEKSDAGIK